MFAGTSHPVRTTLGVLTVGAAALLSGFSAAAQQAAALTPNQCQVASSVAYALMKDNAISPRLATSFEKFRTSNCDLSTIFERDSDLDEKVFGQFRVQMVALRMSDAAAKMPTLAAK